MQTSNTPINPTLQKRSPEVRLEVNFSEIKQAIRSVGEQNWLNFFETLRQQTYNRIRGADNGELVSLKYEIKAIDVIQEKILQLRQKSS